MPKTIFINIDEDVTRASRKLAHELPGHVSSSDVVLVFPKGSVIFSDEASLKKLKAYADELGKRVTIVTADQKGQRQAREAGFAIGDVTMLRTGGTSVDTAHSGKPLKPLRRVAVPKSHKVEVKVLPTPAPAAAPVFAPRVAPLAPPPVLHSAPATFEPLPEPPRKSEQKPPHSPHPSSNLTKYFIAAAVVGGILLAVLATVILPQAHLVVSVHAQPITRDLTVTVDKAVTQPDVQTLALPGQMLDSDEQQTTTFNASGQLDVGDKATGDVQIYNFTHKTLKLDAATTTLTVGTNVYHLVSNVTGIVPTRMVPGTTNPDPSSLTAPVQVIADAPGDGYNLPALTRFEVHNKVLGTIPQQLYAESTDPTQGGISRFRTIISQQDLDNAGKALQQSVLDAAKQQLLSSKGLTLISSAASTQVKSVTFDHSVNDAAETFSGTISAHVTGLAFKEDDLKNLVEQRINSTLSNDTYLVTQQQEDLGEQFSAVDLAAAKGSLAVHFVSMLGTKLDTGALAAEVVGKTPVQVKEILLANPSIDSVEITLQPFWVKSVPRWASKVTVQTKLDLPNGS